MAIAKEITLDTTGGVAAYHYVSSVSLDRMNKFVTATVVSYVSAETFKAGKQPVSFPQPVSIQGFPADGQDGFAFVEQELIKPEPEGDSSAVVTMPYQASRYMLAGGEIVE
jgi:hypothetical protein